MKTEFAGFGLLSKDVRKAAEFYRDVLGADIEDSDVHCTVSVGDISFPIYDPHLDGQAQPLFLNFRNSAMWMEFAVDDVDREYTRICELGVPEVIAPHNTRFGRRVIFFEDPDGNKITLFTALGQPNGTQPGTDT